jgi:17beta-estradiol 17-dehydrogenase / 3alpha(17beta)-hydroxysteroid dehydrogenase (NAD+) / 3-oxoacyl-[acyl-carrier protein] reductase alpha subunit
MLANKLALVTGAASGIGQSIAQTFYKQGASLALVDLNKNVEKSVQSNSNTVSQRISYHVCDVADRTQVISLFEKIKETHRRDSTVNVPNVIINAAGVTRDALFVKMTELEFDQVLNANLKGTYLISQTAARALLENFNNDKQSASSDLLSTYASIVNFSSIVAKNGNVGQTNYTAAKAGIEAMTRTIAKELGKYKIRCNAILPGFIQTPMTAKMPAKQLERFKNMIPLQRPGTSEEVAQLALFLASDLSSYITGSSIECTGGL